MVEEIAAGSAEVVDSADLQGQGEQTAMVICRCIHAWWHIHIFVI
jgi:hypothetical protein